jgi:hypothetical protein
MSFEEVRDTIIRPILDAFAERSQGLLEVEVSGEDIESDELENRPHIVLRWTHGGLGLWFVDSGDPVTVYTQEGGFRALRSIPYDEITPIVVYELAQAATTIARMPDS